MSRGTPALMAVGALTAMSALITTSADAAIQHHHTSSRHAGTPVARVESRAAQAASSVALFAADDNKFQVASGLNGAEPHDAGLFGLAENRSVATAVNPVRGKDGLICADTGRIYPVHHLRTIPQVGDSIDASAYTDEGGGGYSFFCRGVAVRGSFGLATADSQGLLQLIRKKGTWQIDRRFRFGGVNDVGDPHRRGWIPFHDAVPEATTYDTIALAPKPRHNGTFLAVAIDRGENTLVVVSGVGTTHPHEVGLLHSKSLGNDEASWGNGGVAFLRSTPTRALIATAKGFAVLDLRQPSHPRLKVRTTVGDGLTQPSSLTISSDGDHVAVATGPRVVGYRNVLAAVRHGKPFKKQTSFRLQAGADEGVRDVAYTAADALVVLHGDTTSLSGWHLTLVRKVPSGHHAVRGSLSTTRPPENDSLSLWPAP